MKKIYSILVTIVFLILTASCNENFEIADKADSLVSVAINTLNIQKSFNVGESYQAESLGTTRRIKRYVRKSKIHDRSQFTRLSEQRRQNQLSNVTGKLL